MDSKEGLAKLGLFDRCLEISISRETRQEVLRAKVKVLHHMGKFDDPEKVFKELDDGAQTCN